MSFEREEVRKARKRHRCTEAEWNHHCRGTGWIEQGELYLYAAGYLGESRHFETACICQTCAGTNPHTGQLTARWLCLVERKYRVPAAPSVLIERQERCARANALIEVISACGRQFFRHEGRVSHLAVADTGTVFVVDSYTQLRTDTRWPDDWRHFSEGGTLRRLIEGLAAFITDGKQLHPHAFLPQPTWYDVWGYGKENMLQVHRAALEQRVIAEAVPA